MSDMSDEPKKKQARLEFQEETDREDSQVAFKNNLLEQLQRLQNVLSEILVKARENAQESLEGFISDKVRAMSAMIGHYFRAFQAVNVMTRHELEKRIGMLYNCCDIQDAAEELFQVEDEWNSFLETIDQKSDPLLEVSDTELVAGSTAPCHVTVTDVHSGRLCSLQDILASQATILIFLRHFA